jgi:hypothetical protein
MFYWTKLAAGGDVGCVPEPLSHYISYRDATDAATTGAPLLTWARDAQRWAGDIVKVYERTPGKRYGLAELKRHAAVFVFRSTANQFVWRALRGERRLALLKAIVPALPYLRGPDRTPWIRVIAAICAPRWLLKQRMLAEAKRKAQQAAMNPL